MRLITNKINRLTKFFENTNYFLNYSITFNLIIFSGVIISVIGLILSSIYFKTGTIHNLLKITDIIFLYLFLIEFILRFILAKSKSKYFFNQLGIVDFIAIIPIFFGPGVYTFLQFLKILRLLKIIKFFNGKFKRIEIENSAREYLALSIFIITILLFGSFSIYIFETHSNPNFKTIGDGLWWTIVSITTVGYGDKVPITVGGRIISAIIMVLGMLTLGSFSGIVASKLSQYFNKKKMGMITLKHLKNHVVICGWNSTAKEILTELFLAPETKNSEYVIIAQRETNPLDEITLEKQSFKKAKIHYINGDFTNIEILNKANIKYCSKAIILADRGIDNNKSDEDIDARTILTVLAIESTNREIYTCAEILNKANSQHLKNANVDEIVVSGAYTANLLTYAALGRGIMPIIDDLFQLGIGNDFKVFDAPKSFYNTKLEIIFNILKEKHNAIIIAIKRNGKIIMNPDNNTIIKEKDKIYYIGSKQL